MIRRKSILKNIQRVVIKLGSAVVDDPLNQMDMAVVQNLVKNIASLIEQGIEVCLVSSGAVSTGMRLLKLSEKPKSIAKKQALAAIGQGELVHTYKQMFSESGIVISQILLSKEDLENRARYINVRNTLNELLQWNVLPILNENDSVSTSELRYGDNDQLASYVSIKLDADLLVILTTVDGLFSKNPTIHRDAEKIDIIENFQDSHFNMADTKTSAVGSGGMHTKLKSAHIASQAGIRVVIANGKETDILQKIFAGENAGTLICQQECHLNSREKWILSNSAAIGKRIHVDTGAVNAIVNKGKSLLPSGITKVEGHFEVGDIVKIVGPDNQIIARGFTNYSSNECDTIKGHQSGEIESLLGYISYIVAIHRNNMVITNT